MGSAEADILRVGLAGCGIIGHVHRAILEQHPATRLVAIADPRGEEVVDRAGAEQGYSREIDYFFRAVLGDRPIQRAAVESARRSVAPVECEVESIQAGCTIEVPILS